MTPDICRFGGCTNAAPFKRDGASLCREHAHLHDCREGQKRLDIPNWRQAVTDCLNFEMITPMEAVRATFAFEAMDRRDALDEELLRSTTSQVVLGKIGIRWHQENERFVAQYALCQRILNA